MEYEYIKNIDKDGNIFVFKKQEDGSYYYVPDFEGAVGYDKYLEWVEEGNTAPVHDPETDTYIFD